MDLATLRFASTADATRFLAWINSPDGDDFRGKWQIEEAV